MTIWLLYLSTLVTAHASEGRLGFDRVDLLSDSSAAFLTDDLPRINMEPEITGLRFVGQISPVFATRHIEIALSMSTQSVGLRAALSREAGVWIDGGLITRSLLPVGARAGFAWRRGPVRIGLALCAETDASWTSPPWRRDGGGFIVRPALGLGFGRTLSSRAPWMER